MDHIIVTNSLVNGRWNLVSQDTENCNGIFTIKIDTCLVLVKVYLTGM